MQGILSGALVNSVSERLKSLKGDLSDAAFARRCGIQPSSVKTYMDGGSLPSAENLIKICRAFSASIDWLLLGEGIHNSALQDSEFCSILYVDDTASAGHGAAAGLDRGMPTPFPKFILDGLGIPQSAARLLRVRGESMSPTLLDHDLILVDVTEAPLVDGKVYVFTLDGHLFVKRLLRTISGWMIVSDNREMYPAEPVPAGVDFRVHGLAKWVGRRL